MERPVKLTDLPTELLLKILRCDQITGVDLFSVHQTCSRLQEVAAAEDLWTLKLRKKWPIYEKNHNCWFIERNSIFDPIDLFLIFNKHVSDFTNIIDILRNGGNLIARLKISFNGVSDMLEKDYWKKHGCRDSEYKLRYMITTILRDLCLEKLNDVDDSKSHLGWCNLISKHHIYHCFAFLNKLVLTFVCYIRFPYYGMPSWDRTTLFLTESNQLEYDRYYLRFEAIISEIVEEVTSILSSDHPYHSIELIEKEKWANEIIHDNKYNGNHCVEIIEKTHKILENRRLLPYFERPNYPDTPLASDQDVVEVKNNNSYFSSVIMLTVLGRLGVHAEFGRRLPIPNDELFVWREHWSIPTSTIYLINLSDCDFILCYEMSNNICDIHLTHEFLTFVEYISHYFAPERKLDRIKHVIQAIESLMPMSDIIKLFT